MPSRVRAARLVACLLPAIAMPVSAQTSADSAAVAATVNAFHEALAGGDGPRALRLLSPDAVILESGGRETVEEYRKHHLPADLRFAQAVATERGALQITVTGDVAWATSTSTSKGSWQGRPVDVTGAELVVLSRTPAGWVIRAIHWSSR